MNERILALDIGDKRIGVAVSDPMRTIASPLTVIQHVSYGPDTEKILALLKENDTMEVVAGLPLNMDGSRGFQAQKVMDFCHQLEKKGVTVYYQDERLTTVTAEQALLEGNMRRADRKTHVDKVAAAVILRQWLDEQTTPPGAEMRGASMEHEELDLIELVDEEGNAEQFEHLATLDHDDKTYVLVTPYLEEVDEDEDEDDMEVLVLRIEEDEQGEDTYVPEEDDQVAEAVFNKFQVMIEQMDEEEGDA